MTIPPQKHIENAFSIPQKSSDINKIHPKASQNISMALFMLNVSSPVFYDNPPQLQG